MALEVPPAIATARSAHVRQYVLPLAAPARTSLILYYKYAHVADVPAEADAHIALCARLQLSGRVLLASEGLNGTLAGTDAAVDEYVRELCAHATFAMAPSDFKRSSAALGTADPFSRDMFVMCVPELVASGGALVATPLEHTGRGYLSPADWRDALLAPDDGRTVVIDVRNRNETALGRFGRALDPNTRSFAEFPTWVEAHAETLRGKRVLLYCTGGVRCEKASAWVRASGVASEVRHLQGGIHKYLEAFGEDGAEEGAPARADGAAALWRGKNFVFDRRGALGAADDASAPSRVVVGRCVGCAVPWELLDGLVACAVCNEPLLACDACRATPAAAELCCAEHAHLRGAYCRGLAGYPDGALADQILKLEAIAAGLARGARGQRRTLGAQAERVRAELAARREGRSDGGARTRPADAQAPVAEAAETRCLVAGEFPASTAAARRAWPCRIWPLSARPWAFIRDTPPPEGAPADARFCVEVECKVAAVGPAEEGGAGARLAPQGEPARTRVRRVRWDAASGASELAVCLTLPLGPTSAECALQTRLHLAWLGFEMLGDANK